MGKQERKARRESREKKPFSETKFAEFIKKAGEVIKDKGVDLIQLGVKAYSGNIVGALGELKQILGKEGTPEANILLTEFDLQYESMILEYEKDIYALEIEDRKNARNREIQLAQSGKQDWMMLITGILVLGAFIFIIVAVVYKPELQDNNLINQLIGMVASAALGVVYYYFGSSKGSKDKTKLLSKGQN